MSKKITSDKLREFLLSKGVSDGDENFTLDKLVLIDSAKIILCFLSPPGSDKKQLIGMRTVGYFEPFRAAVVNLTVIFKCHHGQKNLDPLNKVTIEYILKEFPAARYIMLATTTNISKVNYNHYLSTGFPVRSEDGNEYTYIKMVNIDHPDFPIDCDYLDNVGDTSQWNVWNDGTFDYKPTK
eukprot:CAMPEP_0194340680 /NCGR_PEP_ID=MMETSP0171-20130528/87246_1 /TAXON_ID=218684 /ORGANISM="Corethron pennatum, Strain L29A3" /LENGTH=181 /DNA_ID=CAMNT_0039105735 /DNA_START=176 /DNA_END=718 /DNA_ORIENTATION=+